MTRLRRFEQIGPPPTDTGRGEPETADVEARFGVPVEKRQVLDLSEGQAFVRCALCKGDSHVTALTCCRCDARLDTPVQRAFNEAFWKRRQEEDAELRAEADGLRARRERADREVADARKHVEWLDQEIALRRARRLTRREGELVITFAPDTRALGLAIGRFFRRALRAAGRIFLRDPGR